MFLCSICHEEYDSNLKISALLCGHIYHSICLENWIKRISSCPECRSTVNSKNRMISLYFSCKDNNQSHENMISNELKKMKDCNIILSNKLDIFENKIRNIEHLYNVEEQKNLTLLNSIEYLKSEKSDYDQLKVEFDQLKSKINCFENINKVINGQKEQIEDMIKQTTDIAELSRYNIMLKNELEIKRNEHKTIVEKNNRLTRDLAISNGKNCELEKAINLSKNEELYPEKNLIHHENDFHILKPKPNFENQYQIPYSNVRINMTNKSAPVQMSSYLTGLSILKKNPLSIPVKSECKKRKIIH